MAKHLFYYIGNDHAYFKALEEELRTSTRLEFEFQKFYEDTETKIQALLPKIGESKPSCIFIDFSSNTLDYLHLARLMMRTQFDEPIFTVGLLDYLSEEDILKESVSIGVSLVHIKGKDTFDVAFEVDSLLNPDKAPTHGFATASAKYGARAGKPCKIGYVHAKGLHLETNLEVRVGDRLELDHFWSKKKIVPSKQVLVTKVSGQNLFYHFKYAVDVEFLFVDEFIPHPDMDDFTVMAKKAEHAEKLGQHQALLKKWVETNAQVSFEKRAKVLIVDQNFQFYQNQQRSDKFPYIIRCLPYFKDIETQLVQIFPQVIAISLAHEAENPRNTLETLKGLAQVIKGALGELDPFVVVFRTELSSKEIQDAIGYPKVMASGGELSVEVLLRMAEVFEKKMREISAAEVDATPKVFLKKSHEASNSQFLFDIEVQKMSEIDVLFQTLTPLGPGATIRLEGESGAYLKVAPSKNKTKVPEYTGLFQGVGENQKNELRRYVNAIFFKDHDAQVENEAQEFKKLNEAKLQERIDEEAKKAAEEAAKLEKAGEKA